MELLDGDFAQHLIGQYGYGAIFVIVANLVGGLLARRSGHSFSAVGRQFRAWSLHSARCG